MRPLSFNNSTAGKNEKHVPCPPGLYRIDPENQILYLGSTGFRFLRREIIDTLPVLNDGFAIGNAAIPVSKAGFLAIRRIVIAFADSFCPQASKLI